MDHNLAIDIVHVQTAYHVAFFFPVLIGLFQKKIPPPPPNNGWQAQNSCRRRGGGGGGLMAQEMQAGGGSQPKNFSSGLTLNFNLDRYTFFNHLKKNLQLEIL